MKTLKKKHFKASVRLDNILEINYLPKNHIRKIILEIVFPENRKLVKGQTEGFHLNDQNIDSV
jgi:hypothetical protein